MPLDPRMFLGIGGPVGPQAMLPPGFRAPNLPSPPPMMQPQGGGGGMPSMGMLAMMPSAAGKIFGQQSGDALKQTAAGTSVAETMNPFGTGPTGLAGGINEAGAVAPGGSFMSWLRGLF